MAPPERAAAEEEAGDAASEGAGLADRSGDEAAPSPEKLTSTTRSLKRIVGHARAHANVNKQPVNLT